MQRRWCLQLDVAVLRCAHCSERSEDARRPSPPPRVTPTAKTVIADDPAQRRLARSRATSQVMKRRGGAPEDPSLIITFWSFGQSAHRIGISGDPPSLDQNGEMKTAFLSTNGQRFRSSSLNRTYGYASTRIATAKLFFPRL